MEVSHLLALLDSWPPGAVAAPGHPGDGQLADLDRRVPPAAAAAGQRDWCRYLAEIEEARDGYGHVAARMWSADGQLLAISRQMVTVFG